MATKDFRASQIETSKIIGTGSISGTTAGIAIYSGSVASNREGSTSDSAMFSNVGSDVFLFVSGTRSNNDFTRTDATLFGGDVVISGTLYAERQVIEVDSVADGDFFVTGNMYVEPDSDSTKSVAFRNAAGNDIFIVDSGNKRIGVNVSDPDAQVEIFGTSTPHLKLSNNTDDFASFAVGTHGDLTITTVDASAAAANLTLTADGTVDINAVGSITIDSSTSTINIGTDDIDQAINIGTDGTRTITIGEAADSTIVLKSVGGDLDILATGNDVDVDAATLTADFTSTFSVDGVGTSNITTNGALTLSGSTGLNIASDSGEIDITATKGNIDVNATAGTIDIDSAGALTIDSTTSIYIGGTSPQRPVNIDSTTFALDASSTVAIDGTGISIDAVDDSNITVTTSAKDLDIAVVGGGTQELRLASAGTGPSALHLNATAGGVNIDAVANITLDGDRLLISDPAAPGTDTLFSVSGSIGSRGTATKGTSVFGGDLVVSGSTKFHDEIIIEADKKIFFDGAGPASGNGPFIFGNTVALTLDGDRRILSYFDTDAVWNDAAANTVLTLIDSAQGAGTYTNSDTNIIFSGSIASRGTTVRGTSVFGGDVHISGSVTSEGTTFGGSLDLGYDTSDTTGHAPGSGVGAIITVDNQPVQIKVAGASSTGLAVTGSVIFGSGSTGLGSSGLPPMPGTDTHFFVSGSHGGRGTFGTSVFGGDLVVSGNTRLHGNVIVGGAGDGTDSIFFDGGGGNSGPWIRGNAIAMTIDGDRTIDFRFSQQARFTADSGTKEVVQIFEPTAATSVEPQLDALQIFSGSFGSRGTTTRGTTVFSGDSAISGSLYKVDSVDGSLVAQIDNSGLVFPSLKVAQFGHANSKVTSDTANNLYVSGAVELRLFGEDAIVLNSPDNGIIKFNKGNTEFLRITNVSDDAVIQPQVSDNDIIFKENKTGHGSEVFRIDSTAQNVLFAAGKKVTFGAATRYIGDGTTYNSNANDLVIQGSNNVILGPGANSQAYVALGTNGQFVVADGAAPANYLMITGSNLGGILSASVHNKNISIHTNNARESFSVVGTGEAVFNDPGPLGEDTVFVVSGAKGSQGTATKGTALFGGDVFISGSTHIATGSAVQGLFLSSPDGSVFRINVANDGGLLATKET